MNAHAVPHSLSDRPELLLPAGSPEKLRYAIAYGADAVYLGLPMASLRTPGRGEQFTPQNLDEHVQYAQQRGVKAYVTINIFPSNPDLKRLVPHLEQLEAIRPDAVIFSDPGVFRLARRYAPSVPLHLSTQANTLNLEACAFWQDLGVERVILAREVPLRDIAAIHEALPDLQLEVFIHGSLCVAYSGRCVISDYLTDNTKNSNKGMCGNSCRWEFEQADAATGASTPLNASEPVALAESVCQSGAGACGCNTPSEAEAGVSSLDADVDPETGLRTLRMNEVTRPHDVYTFEEDEKGSYMLNSRDLCLVRRLREMREAGIVSFKVEGRTKSVYYVATAGRIYREAIDYFQTHATAPEERLTRWAAELSAAGNRGFTEGFADGRPNRNAYSYQDSRSHQTAVFLATALPDAQGRIQTGEGMRFKARNPFHVGDALDWVTPAGVVSFDVKALYDEKGFPIKAVQTNQVAVLPMPPGLENWAQNDRPEADANLEWSVLRSRERATVAC
jgi:putative protease